MSAKTVIVICLVIKSLWEITLDKLQDSQWRKRLPHQVADVYDPSRYEEYLQIVAESCHLGTVEGVAKGILDLVVVFSPLFAAVDGFFGANAYLALLVTALTIDVLYLPIDFTCEWWECFKIDDAHGLNRQSFRSFVKDYASDGLVRTVSGVALLEFLSFVCERYATWTDGFSLDASQAIALGLALVAAVMVFGVFKLLLELVGLRAQYHIEELPEGELRSEIKQMLAPSNKKVKHIMVYDESSKSTSKNAMVLSIPGYRTIFIADNFLNENANDELIAVIAHEVGHLKHRMTALDLTAWLGPALMVALIVALSNDPAPILWLDNWVRSSFNLMHTSYYLDLLLVSFVASPVILLVNALLNYKRRGAEYEADREAVRVGHGEDLVRTLKKAASDELENVNPHPFIELLEYDHPGLANRVAAIRAVEDRTRPNA